MKRDCYAEECDRKAESFGWCDKHYRHWRKAGSDTSLLPPKPPKVQRYCPVGECTNKSANYSNGWCQTHYHRVWRGGTLDEPRKPLPRSDITYRSAHSRNTYLWGKADLYSCLNCNGATKQWAYDGTDPSEKTGDVLVKGVSYPVTYSVWPEFYKPLCFSCHRLEDADRRRRRS